MSDLINIKSADDKDIPVHIFEPNRARIGSIVLIQEIFGVNDHIKSVAKKISEEGFVVWTPEIYHRIEKNLVLGYDDKSVKKGKQLKQQSGWELPVMDVLSCVGNLKIENSSVSILGFCYGGSIAWRSACLGYGISSAICFYGSQIPDFLNLENKCPIQIHLGEKDQSINSSEQQKIFDYSKNSKNPIEIHKYKNADHGFFCNERETYNKESSNIAYSKTIEFLKKFN